MSPEAGLYSMWRCTIWAIQIVIPTEPFIHQALLLFCYTHYELRLFPPQKPVGYQPCEEVWWVQAFPTTSGQAHQQVWRSCHWYAWLASTDLVPSIMLILMVDNKTGGGMFGLTTALKLHEQGKRTVVLEAHRLGMGVGGYSTAKLCSLQRIMFSIIQSKFSDDLVQSYGKMNQEGTPLF